MSRSYKKLPVKKDFVYTTDELVRLIGVTKNTVSNWGKEGLRPSDGNIPYIFNGSEVIRFHKERRARSSVKLRKGQFKCFSCKGRVFPDPNSLSIKDHGLEMKSIWGTCPDCGGAISKRMNETDCDKIMRCADTNTNLATLDEGSAQVQVGIGMDRGYAEGDLNKVNDRVLHEWLQFAGGWDEKTTTAKLATIRSFEASCSDKAFGKLTKVDVVAYRDSLKASVELTNDKPLSVATVRQRASHLKSFLAWLIDQKGFQGLNKSLPHYCALPKKFNAPSLSERERYIPNLAEAVRMIEGMPVKGIKERRDRAMVAIAFLGALRADTATSLRVKHVERSNKIIVQDAKTARTKNGKSLRIKFFPLPEIFENVVCGWKEELLGIGFSPDDALFPDEKHFVAWRHKGPKDRIRAMSSTHAISQAFELASKPLGEKVSPHAAKHCIGTLSLEVCKTPEELKAWSVNMGHENEEVTVRYYKHLPAKRVVEIFESFDLSSEDVCAGGAEEKDLMLLYHEHKLNRGTPEFDRARELVRKRMFQEEVDILK